MESIDNRCSPLDHISSQPEDLKSTFDTLLKTNSQDIIDYCKYIHKYIASMLNFCEAGSNLSAAANKILGASGFSSLSNGFHTGCSTLEKKIKYLVNEAQNEIDNLLSKLAPKHLNCSEMDLLHCHDFKVIVKSFLCIMKLNYDFFSIGQSCLSCLTVDRNLRDFSSSDEILDFQKELFLIDNNSVHNSESKTYQDHTSRNNESTVECHLRIGNDRNVISNKINSNENIFLSRQNSGGARSSVTDSYEKSSLLAGCFSSGDKMRASPSSLFIDKNMKNDAVSQDEIDNVINLLSGWPKINCEYNLHAKTQSPLSKAVGSHLPSQRIMPQTDISFFNYLPSQMQSKSAFINSNIKKGNTWPHPSNSRLMSTVQTSMDTSAQFNLFSTVENTADNEYTRYLAAMKQMKKSNISNCAPLMAWSRNDHDHLNKPWPPWSSPSDGENSNSKQYSTPGDSSCSSDDSCNSDQNNPIMLGLKGVDLVNVMQHKRRHSSGEDGFKNTAVSSSLEIRPRSVEDLLEIKSSHTWPPKQPWLKTSHVLPIGDSHPLYDTSFVQSDYSQWIEPISLPNSHSWGPRVIPVMPLHSMNSFVTMGAASIPDSQMKQKYSLQT